MSEADGEATGFARCRVFSAAWKSGDDKERTTSAEEGLEENAAHGAARCRVFSAAWNGSSTTKAASSHEWGGAESAGYGYERPTMDLIADDAAPLAGASTVELLLSMRLPSMYQTVSLSSTSSGTR